MESFKPDCVISVAIHAHGKPAKYGFAVSLSGAYGKRIFAAAKFVGMSQQVEVELAAVRLGLEQAHRLRQEKIEFRLGPLVRADFLRDGRGVPREEKLKLLYEEVRKDFEGFRLRRFLNVPAEQIQDAVDLAKKASRGIREKGDLR